MDVRTQCVGSSKKYNIRTKMGQFTNKAMMTTKWWNAVKNYDLKDNDILLFEFKTRTAGGLRLRIVRLPAN